MTTLFKLEAKRKVIKYIENIDTRKKGKIKEIIQILKQNPVPIGHIDLVKLKGYNNIYRIRTGNIRIIYEVFWLERKILLHYLGPRKKAYNTI